MTIQKAYHHILMVGSIIGLLASFFLTLNTITLAGNPQASLPCNINPFLSCTSAATAWQSHVFGFPNSILGLVAFSMLFAVGVMLFSGGRAKKPLWLLVNFGLLAAVIFVHWFIFQSLYSIGSLCIYCMVVWAVTWPLFLYTTLWNIKENHFPTEPARGKMHRVSARLQNFIIKYHPSLWIGWYLLVVFLILLRFREFFFN